MRNLRTFFDLSEFSNSRVVYFVLLASATGFVLNLYPIYLFAEMTLIFGPALSLLVAFSVGPWFGGLVALAVSTALLFSWGHPVGYLLFVPEAIIVGYLFRYGWNEFVAALVYWLVVAVPFVIYLAFVQDDTQTAFDLLGKYLANSFMYTLLASAIIWFFSVPRWLNLESRRPFTLRTQIFTILMLSMTLPIVSTSLFDAQRSQRDYLTYINHHLKMNTDRIAGFLQPFFNANSLLIQKQAEVFSLMPKEDRYSQLALAQFHLQNPAFSSMIIADEKGDVVTFSPPEKTQVIGTNVADRPYFREAISGRVFVSQAFTGRGFGSNPIVAISAPVYSGANERPTAILEATLNLKQFSRLIDESVTIDKIKPHSIITDQDNQVVFASADANIPSLHQMDWQETPSDTVQGFSEVVYFDKAVVSRTTETPNGWRIRSVYESTGFTQNARTRYRKLGLLLALAILVVTTLAAFLSAQINGPVRWLLERTLALNVSSRNQKPLKISPNVPAEMVTLMRAHESAERRLQKAFQTEKQLQQKRLSAEQASDAKSEFLSSMSHELRTPLNAISGFSQLLMLESDLSNESKKLASGIQDASDHLISLINNILDMSKIESGKLQLHPDKIELVELLQQSLQLFSRQAEDKKIELQFVKPAARIKVLADKLRLKQIIINLLSNAIKYNKPEGRVLIELEVFPRQCVLSITDTGSGIAPDKINQLFEPFSRLDKERSSIEGHGIGLAVTKKLIELMRGEIWVTSEPGQGSCFRVTLPTDYYHSDDSDSEIDAVVINDIVSLKPCRVLYVEDNDINALVMEKALAKYPQIDYHRVNSGNAGIEQIKQTFFDFILLDIALPDMSGFELLSLMSDQWKTQYSHVFAVSANALSEDVERGLAAGFDEYVTKPINLEHLFELFKSHQQNNG